ncbi:tyrosine-protein kinase EpsD [Clostridium sp. CAG:710]|nr:tyrosine-protein kinase EpsD [Clostridium sp. CAG:710]
MKDELIVFSKPKSNISEDIRTIRTNLKFTANDDAKVLLVTSSVPGEGKSFISANLAAAFAQTGEKVLLVDADLRLGRVHKIFNQSAAKGFSNMLISGTSEDLPEYIKKTNISNLYIVSRGTVPPNPSELLNSSSCKKLVNIFRENFDRVIFDGVPVNGLPDSLVLANLVDRVIIVTTIGYTSIDELNQTKKALEQIDANIAGVVVNKAPTTKRGKYSNYYE